MFWENTVGYLRKGECYSFQTFAIVFSTHENLLAEITGALGAQESHILSKMCFQKMLYGISEMVSTRAFKAVPLGSALLKNYW